MARLGNLPGRFGVWGIMDWVDSPENSLISEYGQPAADWLDTVSAHIRRLEGEWDLSEMQRLPGGTCSLVYACTAPSGPAVLKLVPPFEEFLGELPALLAFQPRGGIGVVRYERQTVAILQQRAVPGYNLARLDDAQGLPVAARLMLALRCPAQPDAPDLESWYTHFLAPDARPKALETWVFDKARLQAKRLFGSTHDRVLLHGDLHHYNILMHSDWVAIDPKGVNGDPAFEPSGFLRNPVERLDSSASALRSKIVQFADLLDLPVARVWGWAFVQTALSAWWGGSSEYVQKWSALASSLGSLELGEV